MNKKGSGTPAAKMGFYILFLILFALAIGYAVKFVETNETRKVDFTELEKSILINRAISCLSGDYFGDIDKNKFNELILKKCFDNDKFSFLLILDEGQLHSLSSLAGPIYQSLFEPNRKDDGDIVWIGLPASDYSHKTSRYVLVGGNKARLNLFYNKNAS